MHFWIYLKSKATVIKICHRQLWWFSIKTLYIATLTWLRGAFHSKSNISQCCQNETLTTEIMYYSCALWALFIVFFPSYIFAIYKHYFLPNMKPSESINSKLKDKTVFFFFKCKEKKYFRRGLYLYIIIFCFFVESTSEGGFRVSSICQSGVYYYPPPYITAVVSFSFSICTLLFTCRAEKKSFSKLCVAFPGDNLLCRSKVVINFEFLQVATKEYLKFSN